MFPLAAMPYLCLMDTLNFFTTFRPTLAGAWIPAVFMVLVQFVCMAGVIIASASLWLLLMMVPYCWAMHGVILGEEKYCERTYGDAFRDYKKRVPRYFLFF